MEKSYETEREELIRALTKEPEYRGMILGSQYFRGPCIVPNEPVERELEINENEALIELKEPISRMPKRHILIVKKDENKGWRLEKKIKILE